LTIPPCTAGYSTTRLSWRSAVVLTSKREQIPGRDEQRVRQRYLRMGKEALVERLITAERTLAEQRLRAEAAEARLKKD
jgi:hypothetical protein